MLENSTLPEEVEGVVLLLTPRPLSAARYSQGIWPLRRWIGCPNDFQLANRILVGAQQAECEMPSNLGRGRHQQGGRAARPQRSQEKGILKPCSELHCSAELGSWVLPAPSNSDLLAVSLIFRCVKRIEDVTLFMHLLCCWPLPLPPSGRGISHEPERPARRHTTLLPWTINESATNMRQTGNVT